MNKVQVLLESAMPEGAIMEALNGLLVVNDTGPAMPQHVPEILASQAPMSPIPPGLSGFLGIDWSVQLPGSTSLNTIDPRWL
jgi:hypothetical protein